MPVTENAASHRLLSALRPRSLTSEAILLGWIAWLLFGCMFTLFRLSATHDIYSAIFQAYHDAPLILLDSIIAPAIVYGLSLAGATVWRSAAPRSSRMEGSVPAADLMRRGRVVDGFVRIFPRLTATLTGRQTGTRAAGQAGAALDGKRLVAAWLLGGVGPLALGYALYRRFPLAYGEYGPFVVVLLDVGAVVFFIWRWPRVFALSRLRPRLSDLAVGALGGYLCYNVEVLIPALPIRWPWATILATRSPHLGLLFVCSVLAGPAAEELLSRGVILASLCKRMPAPWAILITSAAAAVLHLPPTRWLSVFVAWLILCGIYFARDRSLPASIAAHVVTNALSWFPGLMIAAHFLK